MMLTIPPTERHFATPETVRDIVIGMSDGLTVPFALAAGLSGAIDSTRLLVTAGLAEVAAGAIAMGLGGYLAARTEAAPFAGERLREERETHVLPETEAAEVAQVFRAYGVPEETITEVVNAIRSDCNRWVDFMVTFELGMTEPDPRRAWDSTLTIGLSYAAGGLIPLAPYFLSRSVHTALIGSVIVTRMTMFVFGVIKGRFTANRPVRRGWQTVLVGGIAAAAAFTIARLIEEGHTVLLR